MVWVIGGNGMLGTQLCRNLSEKKIDFVSTDRNVDITNLSELEQFANGKKINFIVNCAAYTAVDKAESELSLAEKLNAEGPKNIARLAKKIGSKLIHISTDYVFNGTGICKKDGTIRPYNEDDPTAPIGVYGLTKEKGEKAVLEETEDFYILRTAWLYGFDGKNFVYTMIRAMNTHESVKVVSDQRGSPTFCVDLANVIIKLIKKDGTIPYGIYHVTNEGETTWFDFTKEIFAQGTKKGLITNKSCIINPCTTQEYPTPAKRPSYSVLNKKKIEDALGEKLPDWQDSLALFLESKNFDHERIK